MDVKRMDGADATARHWVGVYAQLARVAELAEGADLDADAAARMATTRARLRARLRYWERRLHARRPQEVGR